MRPPHCAGEIVVDSLATALIDLPSMRPPHCAGEISNPLTRWIAARAPSMRPPHCAGEIATGGVDKVLFVPLQ